MKNRRNNDPQASTPVLGFAVIVVSLLAFILVLDIAVITVRFVLG